MNISDCQNISSARHEGLRQLINHLRCPITKVALREMSNDELQELNYRISNNEIKQYDGMHLKRPLQAGLISLNEQYVYPIEEDIFILLPSNSIDRFQEISSDTSDNSLSPIKKNVQNFYDEFGWQKDETGLHLDTVSFTDTRPVVEGYGHKCHLRVNKYLESAGTYLLDIASGAIPHSEYLTYSEKFDFRICVDFSLLALKEAKHKLGDRGIYILGDITNIPIVDDAIDAVISLHTIYHVPEDEQSKAFYEIHRILKPGASAVVVYTWSYSLFMDITYLPVRLVNKMARNFKKISKILNASSSNNLDDRVKPLATEAQIKLYFCPQNYEWFCQNIKDICNDVDIYVWKSVNTRFLNTYIHSGLFGEKILNLIYWLEDKFPYLAGRFGQYPLFLIKK